jgi:ABC-2 type transport system permease protein
MSAETESPAQTSHGTSDRIGVWYGQARSFAERFARELFRNRTVLFWTIAFPVGFYILTITVFVDTGDIPAQYLPEVKAGIAIGYGMFGAIIASLNAFGQQLAADFEAGRYVQYRSLPLSPTADLAGRMIAGLALSLVAFGATLVAAVATGAEFALSSPVSIPVIAVALVTFAAFWMVASVLVSVVVREARYASIITVSIALVAYFLTGYNGTDPSVYAGPQAALNLMPHTLATRLVTDHAVQYGDTSALTPPAIPDATFGIAVLVLYAVGALIVGSLVMRHVVYRKEVFA